MSAPLIDSKTLAAIKQLRKWKAHGPDGLQLGFDIEHWSTVGQDLASLIHGMFNGQIPIAQLITLILFCSQKAKLSEHMLILDLWCLCNYIYKILSKIIWNRLVLPCLIT